MTFRCLKGLALPHRSNRFKKGGDVHCRNTKNKNESDIPLFRSAAGQQSFVFQAVRLWNDLPKSLARIESLPHFKTEVKEQFLEAFLN